MTRRLPVRRRLLTYGDADEGETVDEVHRAVHRVDDPGGRVRQLHPLPRRRRLLTDVAAAGSEWLIDSFSKVNALPPENLKHLIIQTGYQMRLIP